MNRVLLLHWSFVGGIIGGILIFVGTAFMVLMMSMMGNMMRMMGDVPGGLWMDMGIWMLLWSAITACIVLVAAVQVRQARSPLGWGVAMVIAGALSLPVMGGFMLGALAAIAAGVCAIVASSPAPANSPPVP